jgi:ATP-binding cassette subfamily C protein
MKMAMLEPAKDFALSFFAFAGRKAVVAIVLILASAVLEGIGVLFLLPFLELVSGTAPKGSVATATKLMASFGLKSTSAQLIGVLAVFLVLLSFRNVVIWARDVRLMELSLGFVDYWRSRIFHSLAGAPWSTVSALKHAQVQHIVTNDVTRLAQGTHQVLQGTASVALLGVQLMIAFVLSPVFTAFALVFGAAAMRVLAPLTRKARELGENLTQSGREIHSVLGQFLSGIKLAKAQGAEATYVDRFDGRVDHVRYQLIRFIREQTKARLIVQSLGGVMACAIIGLGVLVFSTSGPVLVALIIILARLTGPFLALQQGIQSLSNMLPAFEAVRTLLAQIGAETPNLPNVSVIEQSINTLLDGPVVVEFSDVHFAHEREGDEAGVLNGLTFAIKAGEMIALVGPSGGGKTTLVDILTGLLTPTTGIVYVGGHPLVGLALAAWRRELAYVPQDPLLFEETLRDNMLWANPQKSDAEVWQALEMAGADDLVRSLREGLDTRVGDRGHGLSGGEKQRICLARAFLRRPRMLVLDEATSAIDLQGEQRLLATLRKLAQQMTVLVISHRLSSLRDVDRILVLRGGRIVEEGSWAELSRREGFLKAMMQTSDQ